MKWLKRISLGTFAIVAAVLLLLTLALNTEWGARTVMQQLAPMAPGHLETRRVSGTLAGPLVLEGFEYRTGPVSLRAEQLRLDLAVMELLTGRVRVDEAAIRGFELSVEEGEEDEEEGGPVELPSLSLPVAIDVRSLTVDGARFHLPGQAPVTFDSAALEGRLAGGRLQLDRLSLEGGPGRLALRGGVDTAAKYRTDLNAEMVLLRPGMELAGTLAVEGDLDRLRLTLETRPPVATRVEATLSDLPWPPAFEATLALEQVPTEFLGIGPIPGPVTGRLRASGNPSDLSLEGWLAAAGERMEIRRLALGREGARLDLHALELEGRDGARMDASGIVALGGEAPRVTLDARWRDVAVPMGENRILASPEGRLTLDGRPAGYEARGEVRLGGAAPTGTWRFRGGGNTQHFQLDSLEADTLGGSLAISGRVAWSPNLEWSATGSGTGLDPSEILPGWPGGLDFRAGSDGSLTDEGPSGTLSVERLEGRLRGRPVAASAGLEFRGLQRWAGNATVSSGESRVSARGRLAREADVTVRLDVNQAGDWFPEAAGSLDGQLRLTGPREALRISGELQGSGLVFASHRADTLTLSLDAGLAPRADPGRIELVLQGGELGGVPYRELDLALTGNRATHQLEFRATDGERELALGAGGGLDDNAWSGRVTALSLSGPRLGDWRLAESFQLAAAADRARLYPLCLNSASGELCARGAWTRDTGLEANAGLSGVPLALGEIPLRLVMDRPVELSGQLDLEADVLVPAEGTRDIRVRLETREAGVSLAGTEGLMRLDLSPVKGRLDMAGRKLETALTVGLGDAGSLDLQLRSEDFTPAAWAESPVSGRVEVALDDISVLAPVAGPLASPAGSLEGELTLDGALGSMGLGGSFSLSDFSAQVPRAGITLERGRAEIRAEPDGLDFEASASSGGGELGADGRIRFEAGSAITGEARVTGADFQAVDLPGVEAWISPDLKLRFEERHLAIDGSVTVPKGNIDAGELQGNGVSASPDVIVAGEAPATEAPAVTWRAEVDVILGENITLKAPGFEGSADGRLHVSDRPGRPTLGRGQLSVSGTYEAYGQNLAIRKGRLLFSDTPLENPALDITAVRVTPDVTAGVRIGGTAYQPQVSLFSEPALGSESQILSYIMLGRPLDSASSSEGATLAGAAASLGIKGGNLLAQQLGTRFGLEEVEVGQSEALGQSALTLGKYLSPRLYIGYGVGLIEPVSVVRLRYELTDQWALEAASGKETTAAIKFNYER